jgi:hypothetical protein
VFPYRIHGGAPPDVGLRIATFAAAAPELTKSGCESGCEPPWSDANRATLPGTGVTKVQVVAVSDITRQAHNPSGRGFEPHPPHTAAVQNIVWVHFGFLPRSMRTNSQGERSGSGGSRRWRALHCQRHARQHRGEVPRTPQGAGGAHPVPRLRGRDAARSVHRQVVRTCSQLAASEARHAGCRECASRAAHSRTACCPVSSLGSLVWAAPEGRRHVAAGLGLEAGANHPR